MFEGPGTVSNVRDLTEARHLAASVGPKQGAYSIDFKTFEVDSERRECRQGGRIVFFLNELQAARSGTDTHDFDALVDAIIKAVRNQNEVQAVIFAWKQPKVEVWLSTSDRRVTNKIIHSLRFVGPRGSFRPHARYNQQVIKRSYGEHWNVLKENTRAVKEEQLNQLMANEHISCLQDEVAGAHRVMRPRAQTTGSNPHQSATDAIEFQQALAITKYPKSVTVDQLVSANSFVLPIEREITRHECVASAAERAMPGGFPDEEDVEQAIQNREQEAIDRRQFTSEIKADSKFLAKVMGKLRKVVRKPRGMTVSIPPTPRDLEQIVGESDLAESPKCAMRHEIDEKRMLRFYKHGQN